MGEKSVEFLLVLGRVKILQHSFNFNPVHLEWDANIITDLIADAIFAVIFQGPKKIRILADSEKLKICSVAVRLDDKKVHNKIDLHISSELLRSHCRECFINE